MKTMIFVGSPNRSGNTMKLVNEICTKLNGTVEIINIFDYLDIKPCIDCAYCHKNYGCIYKDEFSNILERSFGVDCFIIASPMWFGNMSGPMMSFFSRLQTITSGHIYRKDMKHKFNKAGVFIMTSRDKFHSMAKTMETTAEFIFNHFDALIVSEVYAHGTSIVEAGESHHDLKKCHIAAKRLNDWYEDKQAGRYFRYGYASENYVRLEEQERIKRCSKHE